MKWAETIRVLCSLRSTDDFKEELVIHLREFCEAKGIKNIAIMLQSAYEHDLLVALFWNKKDQPARTLEGVFIADYLKQFGSVNHSVWTVVSEMSGKSCRQKKQKKS